MRTTWFHVFSLDTSFNERQFSDVLIDAGLQMVPLGGVPQGAGVVVFDRVTDELCDFFREVSKDGLDRVLALPLSQEGLHGDGVLDTASRRRGRRCCLGWRGDHRPPDRGTPGALGGGGPDPPIELG